MPNHPDFPDDFGSYEDDLPLDDPSSGLKYEYAPYASGSIQSFLSGPIFRNMFQIGQGAHARNTKNQEEILGPKGPWAQLWAHGPYLPWALFSLVAH